MTAESKQKCSLCSRVKDHCVVYPITPEENRQLRSMGVDNPPSFYAYCRSCIRLMSNPTLAVNLMVGVQEQRLRALGVHDAEARAKKFGESLASRVRNGQKLDK